MYEAFLVTGKYYVTKADKQSGNFLIDYVYSAPIFGISKYMTDGEYYVKEPAAAYKYFEDYIRKLEKEQQYTRLLNVFTNVEKRNFKSDSASIQIYRKRQIMEKSLLSYLSELTPFKVNHWQFLKA